MAANRIYIQVDFQSQSAESAIKSLNQNIESIGDAANQSTQQATTGVKSFSVAVNQAQSAVDALSQSVVGMGVARMAREIADLGDNMIRLNLAFKEVPGGMATRSSCPTASPASSSTLRASRPAGSRRS